MFVKIVLYLTLLPQRIACYLTAYFDEQNDWWTTNSIFPVQPTLSRSLLQKFPV